MDKENLKEMEIEEFVVNNEEDYEKLLQMIEEQKNLMNNKLEAKTKELEEVTRQKQRNIQEKERLLKEIATCDQDMKETKMKLFAADADIIMEEYTEMEQAKELKALQLQLMRESEEYQRPASSRVPRNGTSVVDFLTGKLDEEADQK